MLHKILSRVVLAVAVVALAVAAPAAFAGKGGNGKPAGGNNAGSTSTLALVMVDDANGNGAPNWGDTVTFSVSTSATDSPWVEVACYQGGTLVYSAWAGFYDSYPGAKYMPLSSPSWTSGAADCVATLNTKLATLKFHVDA